jgi:hypothetical protein
MAALALLVVGASGSARAESARFFVDGGVGVMAPIADSTYANSFLPSPKLSLRLGAEIWLTRRVGLAPELALDGGPLLGQRSSGVTTGKLRFQPGLRVLFGFGHGHAFFLRYLVGGEVLVYGPGGREGAGKLNLGLATEPGVGMQFRVSRHAVVGFTLGVPIGLHSYGTPRSEVNVDFDATFFVGLRL